MTYGSRTDDVRRNKLLNLLLWADDWVPSKTMVQYLIDGMLDTTVEGEKREIRSGVMRDSLLQVLPMANEDLTQYAIALLLKLIEESPTNSAMLGVGPLWDIVDKDQPERELLMLLSEVASVSFSDRHVRQLLGLVFFSESCTVLLDYLLLVKKVLATRVEEEDKTSFFSMTGKNNSGLRCPPRSWPERGFTFHAELYPHDLRNEPRLVSYASTTMTFFELFLRQKGLVVMARKGDKPSVVELPYTFKTGEWVTVTVTFQYKMLSSSVLTLYVNHQEVGQASLKYPGTGGADGAGLMLFTHRSRKNPFCGLVGSVVVLRDAISSENVGGGNVLKDCTGKALWCSYSAKMCSRMVVVDSGYGGERGFANAERGEESSSQVVLHAPRSLRRAGGASLFVLLLKRFSQIHTVPNTNLTLVRDCIITTVDIITKLCEVGTANDMLTTNGFGLISLALQSLPSDLLPLHIVRTLTSLLHGTTTHQRIQEAVLHDLLVGPSGFNIWRRAGYDVQSFMLEQVASYIAKQPSIDFEATVSSVPLLLDILDTFYSYEAPPHKSHTVLQRGEVKSLRRHLITIIWRLLSNAGGTSPHLVSLLAALDRNRTADHNQLQDILQLLVDFIDMPGGRNVTAVVPVSHSVTGLWSHPCDIVKMLAVKIYVLEGHSVTDPGVLGAVVADENSIHVYTALKEAAMGAVHPSATTPEQVEWSAVVSPESLENLFVAAFSPNMHPYFQAISRADLEKGLSVNRDAVITLTASRPAPVLLSHIRSAKMGMTGLVAVMLKYVVTATHGVEFIKGVWEYVSGGVEGVQAGCFMLQVFSLVLKGVEEHFLRLNLLDFNTTRSLMSSLAVVIYLAHEIIYTTHDPDPAMQDAIDHCLEASVAIYRTADRQSVTLLDVGQTLTPPPPLTPGFSDPPKPATGSVIYEILLSMSARLLVRICSMHKAMPSGALEQRGVDLHKISETIKVKATSHMHANLSKYLSSKLEELHGKFDTQVAEAQRLSETAIKLLNVVIRQRVDGTNPVGHLLYMASRCAGGNLVGGGNPERRSMLDVVEKFSELLAALNPVTVSALQCQPGGLRELDPSKWTPSMISNYKSASDEYLAGLVGAMPSMVVASRCGSKTFHDVIRENEVEREDKISMLLEKFTRNSKPTTPKHDNATTTAPQTNFALHADWGKMERKVKDSIALQWWNDDHHAASIPPLRVEGSNDGDVGQKERIFWKIDPSCRMRIKRYKPTGMHAGVGDYVKKPKSGSPTAKLHGTTSTQRVSLEDIKMLPMGGDDSGEVADDEEDEIGALNQVLEGENERVAEAQQASRGIASTHKFSASLVTPLELIEGELTITPKQVLFIIDKTNLTETSRRKDILLTARDVAAVYPRRYYLQQNSLEIFVEGDTTASRSYMFKFDSIKERKTVIRTLRGLKYSGYIQRGPPLSTRHASELMKKLKITDRWVKGGMSNYDYLMELNLMAGRSFGDVNQYPVFPWVLTDYTSESIDLNDVNVYRDLGKPVGALNPTRLAGYIERFELFEGEVPKFHYGSHYSYGGAVLYYLVRVEPYSTQALKLQDGTWDIPDRMFHSIESAWKGVLEAPTDVKELLPEFYSDPEFLTNHNNYNFGALADGTVMNDVILPPWAGSDANRFVSTMRTALESPYVTENLHKWIDLIFGYKQKGEKAIESHNTFYYLTYEGSVDWGKVDPVEAEMLQRQIQSFGQTPSQLFARAHPGRAVKGREVLNEIDTENFAVAGEVNLNTDCITAIAATDPEHIVALTTSHTFHTLKIDPISCKLTSTSKEIKLPATLPVPSGIIPRSPWQSTGVSACSGDSISDPMCDIYSTQNRVVGCPVTGQIYTAGHWDETVKGFGVKKLGQVAESITPLKGLELGQGYATAVDVSGRYTVTGTVRGLVEIGVKGKTRHVLKGHGGAVTAVGVAEGVDTVVSGCGGDVLVHSLKKGQLVRVIRTGVVNIRKVVVGGEGWVPVIVVLGDCEQATTDCKNIDFLDTDLELSFPQKIQIHTLNGRLIATHTFPPTTHVTSLLCVHHPRPFLIVSSGSPHSTSSNLHFIDIFPPTTAAQPIGGHKVTVPHCVTALHSVGGAVVAGTSSGKVLALNTVQAIGMATESHDDVPKKSGIFSGW